MDPYDMLMELMKEQSASNLAMLDLLVEKELIGQEDVDRWLSLKARHTAKLDQIQSAAYDYAKSAVSKKEQQAPHIPATSEKPIESTLSLGSVIKSLVTRLWS